MAGGPLGRHDRHGVRTDLAGAAGGAGTGDPRHRPTETEAAAVRYPPPAECLRKLVRSIQYVKTPHLSIDDRHAIELGVESAPVWQGKEYYDAYLELKELVGKCISGKEWDVLAAWSSTHGATPSTQIVTPPTQNVTPVDANGNTIM